ncbi:trans-resveratrol di-O-methyltransferase-like [Phoenix dactylifera]|uniref:Trans-resveratrol di-O-methyltransferase-like n=1 Tax=Phoenix dactylifera TaxID=42345 RepID=A0A8B7C5T1_PHODC|nr:trans-resveratrol di-O-methyltransferase-like [Phoenix dactylifera]
MEQTKELLQAQTHVYHHIHGNAISMFLKCAVELGIPDAIHAHGQPLPFSRLVSSLAIPPSKAPSLRRLLRLLTHTGFFTIHPDLDSSGEDAYSLTPSSQLLLKSSPTSLASFVVGILDSSILSPFQLLSAWYRSEHPATAAEMARGMPIWDWARANPHFNLLFNEAMASDTSVVAKVLVTDCKAAFHGLRSLVDVGGGNGMFAMGIAEAFPHIKCTVYDLPHVVATMPESPVVEAVGGDMFERIPPADAVFLKLILHTLTDEQCVKILRLCKEAIPKREEGGKVLIVDVVLNSDQQDYMVTESQLVWDLVMLQATGGKEREEHEWKKVFTEAGFVDYRVTPLGARSLIEVFP